MDSTDHAWPQIIGKVTRNWRHRIGGMWRRIDNRALACGTATGQQSHRGLARRQARAARVRTRTRKTRGGRISGGTREDWPRMDVNGTGCRVSKQPSSARRRSRIGKSKVIDISPSHAPHGRLPSGPIRTKPRDRADWGSPHVHPPLCLLLHACPHAQLSPPFYRTRPAPHYPALSATKGLRQRDPCSIEQAE